MAKILVVDDEPDFAEYVSDVLNDLHHDVEHVSDARSFAKAYTNSFDVIFTDLFMPDMDGVEVIRFLAENRSFASLVLMSGKDQGVLNSSRELALARGMPVLGVLQKPFEFCDVEHIMSTYVPRPCADKIRLDADALAGELEHALADNQIYLNYQPQCDLVTGKAVGVEALVRWMHPGHGLIPPSLFVPLLEQGPGINQLSDFVFQRALLDLATITKVTPDLTMSINFSAKCMEDVELPEKLGTAAQRLQLDPARIVCEMTETALSDDLASYMDILNRLRMRRFGVSIDDFGTGYSSLLQLIQLPFSELKIDQSFVSGLLTKKECRSIVSISTMLGRELGMRVVAEGIEDPETVGVLQEFGCHHGQGFAFAPPMLLDETLSWLKSDKALDCLGTASSPPGSPHSP